MSAVTYGWLVLAFPLGGTILISLLYKRLPGRTAGWIGAGAILGAFLSGLGALSQMLAVAPEERSFEGSLFAYAQTLGVDVDLGILVDPLSLLMVLIVSGVSFLIHVYSIAYLDSDAGYSRFFAYLNFFVFSMLLLVLAGNFILLIVGWAFVGAASYLLVSFWYRRGTATKAGMKAFVINVIGDVGLVLAAFLLFSETGALSYSGVFGAAHDVFAPNEGVLVIACLLLLVGAFAKSAQVPLHTWLPDAMEGPTPVSALIHAATMVTAGVYLIARCHPLFEIATDAALVAAIIGTATLFIAATVALVMTDLKRSIAYSTMSQIGYMVLGVSAFAYSAGMFHLMTHAFFKALLFMGAGSIISAMGGEQSLDRMGGLRKAMPFTFVVFVCGALALSGFPGTAGFFSKDAIIDFTLYRGGVYTVLAIFAYAAALLTAIYTFRLVFRVFFGKRCPEAEQLEAGHLHHADPVNPATGEPEDTDVGFPGEAHHIAERDWPMKIGMAPLALLALVAGGLQIPGVTEVVTHFLEPTFAGSEYLEAHPTVADEWRGLAIGGAIAVVGIGIAFFLYIRRPGVTASLQTRLGALHNFLSHKWYFDELIEAGIVRPMAAFGRFGRNLVESELVQGFLVGGATSVVRVGTSAVRTLQSGYLRAYAALLLIGMCALALYFLIVSS